MFSVLRPFVRLFVRLFHPTFHLASIQLGPVEDSFPDDCARKMYEPSRIIRRCLDLVLIGGILRPPGRLAHSSHSCYLAGNLGLKLNPSASMLGRRCGLAVGGKVGLPLNQATRFRKQK